MKAPARQAPLWRWLAPTCVVLLVALTLGVCLGSVAVSPRSVLAAVAANIARHPESVPPLDQYIVWELRLPRVLLAALVGAALSLAGAALQGLVRNPLADPYIIGVSSGASFGAVVVMTYGSMLAFGLGVSAAAFVGAALTVALVFGFAQREGHFTDSAIVLAGVAIGYVAMAATSFVQLRADPGQIRGILFWMLGSFASARWSSLLIPVVVIVVVGLWMLTQHKNLNALALGDDDAVAVGVNLRTVRLGLLLSAAVLTAISVSNAGGVGFVGLIVPHVARMLVGADYRRLLPMCAAGGAAFLVTVDIVARTINRPEEYPLTIFTAFVGGPLFLWLQRRGSSSTS